MIDEYARILEAVALKGDPATEEEAVKKLIAHLVSSGRIKLAPAILREVKKIAARRIALHHAVEVAHEAEAAHALRAAAAEGIKAAHATVNHSLIRGWRGRTGDTLIDRSAKRALIDIYKRVIQ